MLARRGKLLAPKVLFFLHANALLGAHDKHLEKLKECYFYIQIHYVTIANRLWKYPRK